MRLLRLVVVAAVLTPAIGCNWLNELKNHNGGDQARRGGGKLEPVAPEKLVDFLNDRASRLQTLQFGEVRTRVSGKGIPVAVNLDGNLACAQPRYFRMTGSGRALAVKVDLGSNPDQFWLYLQAPGDKPVYLFASHADFESGKAKLPESAPPFEPDWVLQSLGMIVFPPGLPYTVAVNEKERTYTLSWPVSTPTGLAVKKEVVFDGDGATGTRAQVRKHVMREAKTNKVICTAEILSAKTVQMGAEPRSGKPLAVQYPTHLILKWDQPEFKMDLTLEQAQVNHTLAPEEVERLFTRKDYPNATAIDLARYEFR